VTVGAEVSPVHSFFIHDCHPHELVLVLFLPIVMVARVTGYPTVLQGKGFRKVQLRDTVSGKVAGMGMRPDEEFFLVLLSYYAAILSLVTDEAGIVDRFLEEIIIIIAGLNIVNFRGVTAAAPVGIVGVVRIDDCRG
jgi:hypothetical protein